MSSQQDNPDINESEEQQVENEFNEIINLIQAMHTPFNRPSIPSNRPFFTRAPIRSTGTPGTLSHLFDPRQLTFGETIEDDSETDVNVATPTTDVEHPLPELVIQGVAAMPEANNTDPLTEEKVSDESDSTSDDESDTKECCVCYKSKTDLHTIVLPTCGHIICQSCFFRWLRTSPTCPMCRDNFTSWDRVSDDTIRNDIYEITSLFNRVSKTHNSLMRRCDDLRHTMSHLRKKNNRLRDQNFEMKSKNNGMMSAIIRRRNYTNYIRGYNAAIMTGNLVEDQNHLNSNDYINGIRRGLLERDKFLETIGVKPDEFIKVQPHLLSVIQSTHQEKKKMYKKGIYIRPQSDRNNLFLDKLFNEND